MIDLVIFDSDGVLVDSEPLSARFLQGDLANLGLTLGLDEIVETFLGLSMDDTVRIIEQRLKRPLPPGFVTDHRRRKRELFARDLRPVPGVRAALAGLRWPSCVASSGSRKRIEENLGLTGLLDLFRGRIFSAEEVARGKPWPDLFLHAAERMGAESARTVVVEDSPRGVQAGVAAGMTVLGFASLVPAALLQYAGVRVFDSMDRLPDLLDEVDREIR